MLKLWQKSASLPSFATAGSCIAPQRVFLCSKKYITGFCKPRRIYKNIKGLRWGSPVLKWGRLSSKAHSNVLQLLNDAKKVAASEKEPFLQIKGWFVHLPCLVILMQVLKRWTRNIWPVMPIIPFSNRNEVVSGQTYPSGLASYVVDNHEWCSSFLLRALVGMVGINEWHHTPLKRPWRLETKRHRPWKRQWKDCLNIWRRN